MIHRYWDTDEDPGLCPADLWGDVSDWTRSTVPFDLPEALQDGARHRSNLARYLLLAQFGGVYVDHDAWLQQPFDVPSQPWVATYRGVPCGALCGGIGDVWSDAHRIGSLAAEIPAPDRSGAGLLADLLYRGRLVAVPGVLIREGEPGPVAHRWATSRASY